MDLELTERAVVVEQDRAGACTGEAPGDPLLDGRVDGRGALRPSVAARVAAEPRQEALGPPARIEILDALRHRLQPPLPLASRQAECRRELLDDAVDVPRVHEEGTRQHLRRARELGEEERAAPAPGRAGLGLA